MWVLRTPHAASRAVSSAAAATGAIPHRRGGLLVSHARKSGEQRNEGAYFTYEPIDPQALKDVAAAQGGDSVQQCINSTHTVSHRYRHSRKVACGVTIAFQIGSAIQNWSGLPHFSPLSSVHRISYSHSVSAILIMIFHLLAFIPALTEALTQSDSVATCNMPDSFQQKILCKYLGRIGPA